MRPHDISLALGWRALATYLGTIGITVSWTALETRGRRYRLPGRGPGVRGRQVVFTRDDIAVWVEHLTGLRLDKWLEMRAAAPHPEVSTPPRRRRRVDRDQHLKGVLQFPTPLFVLTTSSRAFGEQPVRRGSAVLASPSTESLALFDPESLRGPVVQSWRYDVARIATPSDLHAPTLSGPQRRDRSAVRLVGAFEPGGRQWRWCRVPGEFFGNEWANWDVAFLASDGLPRFAEAIASIRATYPTVVFVTWLRRIEVLPVIFEPLDGLNVKALLGLDGQSAPPSTGSSGRRKPPAEPLD